MRDSWKHRIRHYLDSGIITSIAFYLRSDLVHRPFRLRIAIFAVTLTCSLLYAPALWAQPSLQGYVKYLPAARVAYDFSDANVDHLLHQRFNARWDFNEHLSFRGSLRTRLFYGYGVGNVPGFADFIADDFGSFDAGGNLISTDNVLLHTIADRFHLDWHKDKWHVRLGRQRINWGINMVSNPNDLFNVYSFFDFDYEERPGADALRVQYFASALSRVELAYSPGRTARESVAAMLYSFNRKGYDVQFVSGYFRNRYAVGTGWAGSIKDTGFKGELTFFTDLEPQADVQASNVVVALSADHRFGSGLYVVLEYLYNQQREGVEVDLQFFTQPLRADNLSFTDHALFANATYPVSPVSTLGLAGFYYPSEEGFFISPNWNYGVAENLDLLLISQIFAGSRNSLLGQAGYLVAAALKWSF